MITYGSVCSGIEAATVAWHGMGWKPAWFSEIDSFASSLLKHHYPDVPNLGDMTTLPKRILAAEVDAPDVLCGGTPCQAFSIAGLRKSLDDDRGNLSLVFCDIANAIDTVRSIYGKPESVIFWENVPGVLNTKDNAFGCFLAGLAGENEALIAPGGRWSNAGCVFGPKRTVAWRVLDTQYFGVAQRRRRVFVVASARKGFNPTEILFEFKGLRRDTAPRRESGKDTTGSTGDGIARCVTAGEMKRQDCTSPNLVAYTTKLHNTKSNQAGKLYEEYTVSLQHNSPPAALLMPMQVRRLTPVECERLQGFPDNYTLIPKRPKDGPRYKALGNSWAVPVIRWLGWRMFFFGGLQ